MTKIVIIVGVIYRSHTSIDCFNADIDSILQILTKENKIHYLLGDFNIDLLQDEKNIDLQVIFWTWSIRIIWSLQY